jgi:hypothetical protein
VIDEPVLEHELDGEPDLVARPCLLGLRDDAGGLAAQAIVEFPVEARARVCGLIHGRLLGGEVIDDVVGQEGERALKDRGGRILGCDLQHQPPFFLMTDLNCPQLPCRFDEQHILNESIIEMTSVSKRRRRALSGRGHGDVAKARIIEKPGQLLGRPPIDMAGPLLFLDFHPTSRCAIIHGIDKGHRFKEIPEFGVRNPGRTIPFEMR